MRVRRSRRTARRRFFSALASTTAIPVLAAAELLHGLSFALLHLACLGLIEAATPPERRATALALYGTLGLGLSGVLATLATQHNVGGQA